MERVVGIDIAKHHFDLHLLPQGRTAHYPNNAQGIADSGRFLAQVQAEAIVLEATGGYEQALAVELQTRGLPVLVVNPRRVRDYARAMGLIAKTDKIDAKVLAEFATCPRLTRRELPDAHARQRRAWIAHRDQLVQLHVAESNRLEHGVDPVVSESIRKILTVLKEQIAALEGKLAAHIAADPKLQHHVAIIDSVPGLGVTSAVMLVTRLPELGRVNRRQIAALVGVAPFNRDSGQYRGKRMTGGGRVPIRCALYMPMLTVIRYNERLRTFYQRLVANGKAKMTAIVAVMRKLLTILNTMIQKDQLWNSTNA